MGCARSSPDKGDNNTLVNERTTRSDSYVVRSANEAEANAGVTHAGVSLHHGADEYPELRPVVDKDGEGGGGGGSGGGGEDGDARSPSGASLNMTVAAPPSVPDDMTPRPSRTRFADVYAVGELLGVGNEGKVYACWKHGHEKDRFAVKVVDEANMDDEEIEMLLREVEVLKQLSHPNIEKLHDVFFEEDESSHDPMCYIVTELLPGGELIQRILQKDHYSEKNARHVMQLLLRAVAHCHSLGIVHRDIKPQNLMLQSTRDDWHIKVVDFGMAKRVKTKGPKKARNRLTSICGTPQYMAPEIFAEQDYGEKVDVWAIGVVGYILLSGWPPFIDMYDDSEERLAQLVREARVSFDDPVWEHVSASAKDFTRKAMTKDMDQRPTAAELLQHEWITGHHKLNWASGAFAHLHQSHAKMKRYHERHSSDAKRAAASQSDSQASDRSSDYAMSSPL